MAPGVSTSCSPYQSLAKFGATALVNFIRSHMFIPNMYQHPSTIIVWVVVSNIFGIFTPKIGKDSHFHNHIFQMGWFNHQLVVHNFFQRMIIQIDIRLFDYATTRDEKTDGLVLHMLSLLSWRTNRIDPRFSGDWLRWCQCGGDH